MASGHYESRRVLNPNPSGPDYLTVMVWVADPAPVAPATKVAISTQRTQVAATATAAQRTVALAPERRIAADEAARARAAAAAASAAALARARSAAYDRLRDEQRALLARAGMVKPKIAPPPAPVKPPPGVNPELRYQRTARLAGEARAKAETWYATEASRQGERAYLIRKHDALTGQAPPTEIEAILREEAKRAAAGQFDGETVAKLSEKYQAYAEKAAVSYTKLVDAINAAIDKGDIATARTLYQGKAFRAAAAEYQRLFGNGKDPRADGAFSAFYRDYAAIDQAQTDFWKRKTKEALDHQGSLVDHLLAQAEKHHDVQAMAELEKLQAIYGGKTGTTLDQSINRGDGRPGERPQTVREALTAADAARRIEMERQRAQYEAADKRRKALMKAEGLTEGLGGRLITHAQAQVERYSAAVVRSEYGGKPPRLARAEDLTAFADKIVAQWDREHPRPAPSKKAAWLAARQAFERETFGYFGQQSPAAWDRLFQLPGVSHALAIVQAPMSAIGAATRVGKAFETGGATTNLLGYAPDLGSLPQAVKDQMEAAAKAFVTKAGAAYGGGRLDPRAGMDQARRDALASWLATPAGQAWAKGSVTGQQTQGVQELKSFYDKFYGQGDAGSKLDALNQFGSRPFANDAANLLFQLLADPTNAIPLKFTTYLARAKYAAEAGAAGSKFLGSSKLGLVRDFAKVDEGTLRFRSEIEKALKASGREGVSAKQLAEQILADVAGIADKGAREKAITNALSAAGINPRAVSATQLFSLTEKAVADRAARTAGGYVSQADALGEKLRATEAAQSAAARARETAQLEAAKAKRAGLEARAAAAETSRARLARQKVALQERTAAEIAAAPPPPVAPAKPRPTVAARQVREAAKFVETPVTAPQELGRRLFAEEHYRPDVMGNWLPKTSLVAGDPAYRKIATAARGGDAAAQAELAVIARRERSRFLAAAEDRPVGAAFQATPHTFVERAGVSPAAKDAVEGVIAARETLRHLKRVGAMAKDSARRDAYLAEFVAKPSGGRIERVAGVADWSVDPELGSGVHQLFVGEDLVEATAAVRGLHDTYEVFSGLPDRVARYAGTEFDNVRSAAWRDAVGPKQFGKMVAWLDGPASIAKGGIGGFRDGGQLLFEFFHGLRLSGQLDRLETFSHVIDGLAGPESLFGAMWKVMEERAGLPWAGAAEKVEADFLAAAELFGLHPQLALSMIPNGYFAHQSPARFRLSSALRHLVDAPGAPAAPARWVESDVLRAVTSLFDAGAGSAEAITHYVAERFGSFGAAFKIRGRMADELAALATRELGVDGLAEALLGHDALLGDLAGIAARRGDELANAVRSALRKDPPRGRRPVYPELRDAVRAAYDAGELPVKSLRVHQLFLLASLQDAPRTIVGPVERFLDYATQIGELDAATRWLRPLMSERVGDLAMRFATERLGRTEKLVDELTGAVIDPSATPEWRLWDRLGFTPDEARVRAWADNVARGGAVEAGDEAARLRELAAAHERDVASRAYAGTMDYEARRGVFAKAVADVTGETNPARRAAAVEHLGELFRESVYRLVDGGVTADEVAALADVARLVPPELLAELRDFVGRDSMARWLALTPGREVPAAAVAADAARTREAAAAAARPAAPIMPPSPAQTVRLSEQEGLLAELSGMSEEQWWKYAGDRAGEVLRDPAASAEARRAARRMVRDISEARFAKARARAGGWYVPSRERARFRRRVLAEHGREAGALMRPNAIGPYVEDQVGLAVEQGRSYWRQLQTAAPEAAPSKVARLGPASELDHFPAELWGQVEEEVRAAIEGVRGFKGNLRTASRGAKRGTPSGVLAPLIDRDAAILKAKTEVLRKLGISVEAYDEARRVLRWAYVQRKASDYLMGKAAEEAARTGEAYKTVFLRLRAEAAAVEGERQLGRLAFGELYGNAPEQVMAEFTARWADDGQLRATAPKLTPFQRRTLEAHVRALSGVADLADSTAVGTWLASRNAPPLHARDAAREFLVEIGAWSPRRAEQISQGAASWSVEAEAAYWRTNWGLVPDWANPAVLDELGPVIFRDQAAYYDQMRTWGIFNRQAEINLRLSGETAAQIEEAVLRGDPALGLKGKRALDEQRRYMIERWGDRVARGDQLVELPWLMYPDEYRSYMAARVLDGSGLDRALIQNPGELDEVVALINGEMDHFWDTYMRVGAAEGPITYDEIFRLSSAIQARLLANPKWARRMRDRFGDMLHAQAYFQRALIFMQPSFVVTNVVDAPIKTAWYRWTRRGLFRPSVGGASADAVRRAAELTPQHLGLNVHATLYALKQRRPIDYFRDPQARTAFGRAVEIATGGVKALVESGPAAAAKVELTMKMRLGREIYAARFDEAVARLGSAELADAFVRKFVKEEVGRMWPTVGDGPIERLFNTLVPFSSYMVRNRVLFISEALAHPSIFNQIEFVGQYIERQNRANWEREHPGEPMPDAYARRIELPWAPGTYLDLGQFSDATRGLKPIYAAARGPQSAVDFTAQWVRLVNPAAQAGIAMLANAWGVAGRVQWQPILDAGGYVTGYRQVVTGWTEPWSNDQPDAGSVFWLADLVESFQRFSPGGFTIGEVTQLMGKAFLFDAISTPSREAGMYDLYKSLKARDPKAAAAWLTGTPEGQQLKDWLISKAGAVQDVADWLSLGLRADADPKHWFHTQTPEFQRAVGVGYGTIERIRSAYADKLSHLSPGTAEYRATKAEMYLAISAVYRTTPELVTFEVLSKSPAEWSAQLARWQTDDLTERFFALDGARPQRSAFTTAAAYNAAVAAWDHQKAVFLAAYPQVATAIAGARTQYQAVRDQTEAEWDRVLTRISQRNEAIDAARAAGDHNKVDLLYLANSLDYSILERDRVALDFTADDYAALPKGVLGPPRLLTGALKTVREILDLDLRAYEKAVAAGTGQAYLDRAFYSAGLAEVILKAKGGDPFGTFSPATFVAELRKRPKLLALYLAAHPGKAQEWARNEQYVALVGAWGRAAQAGNWDQAGKLWDALPQWAKDRYNAKHPGRAAKATATAEYVGYLQRWTKYFDAKDTKGGMDFFWSMPAWVRERYFAAHPDKRVKWEGQLKHGQQLAEYFSQSPDGRAGYLVTHPDLGAWLAQNVSSKELTNQAIQAGYRAIPADEAWLRRVYREKYPDVFSQASIGTGKLRRVYDKLAAHPEYLPAFERWQAAVLATYAEMLKRTGARPREVSIVHAQHGKSRSAAQTSV